MKLITIKIKFLRFERNSIESFTGEKRLKGSAIRKVKNYYQEVAWAALSGMLDHVVLWWSPEALASHHRHGAEHLKNWLRQFIQKNAGEARNHFMKYTFDVEEFE